MKRRGQASFGDESFGGLQEQEREGDRGARIKELQKKRVVF